MGTTKKGKASTAGLTKGKKPAAKSPAKRALKKTPVRRSKTGEDAHKYEATRDPARVAAFEELGSLPESYGEEVLYLIARDPHWLFTYWDIDWTKYSKPAGSKIFLKICTQDDVEESRIEINPEAKNWYVPVKKTASLYYAELGYTGKKGGWKSIVRSAPVATPASALSDEHGAEFATVPFHLTLQRLLEMVRGSMQADETLARTLSRLQNEGRETAFKSGSIQGLTAEQKKLLASLFGGELIDTIGMGSGEIERLLRKKLQEKLSSETSSGIVPKGRLAEEVSSLFSALGGWGSQFANLFSGAGFWGPEVTSLFSGVGASWSAQPFGAKKAAREFFMHVNAEVIFYGGTHPDAKVWIDGKPVRLNPDGTFRYHFRFPDGDYSIPIVAQSPDGIEERSATLGFKRETARKGKVGHTGQPKQLKKPIGKKK